MIGQKKRLWETAVQRTTELMISFFVPNAQGSKRGFLPFMPLIILVFGIIMLIPIMLGMVNDTFLWIMRGFFALTIYFFVAGVMGKGMLTWVLSGILIYIFVWRLWYLFAAGYMLFMVLGFGFGSVIFFGLQQR